MVYIILLWRSNLVKVCDHWLEGRSKASLPSSLICMQSEVHNHYDLMFLKCKGWNSVPYAGIRRRSLWKVISIRCGALRNGSSVLKGVLREPVSWPREDNGCLWTRKQGLTRHWTWPCGHLSFGPPASTTVRNTFLFFISSLAYGKNIAAGADQNNNY